MMLHFDVITIFPDIFQGFINESLLARGQKKKLIKINLHNLRKWTADRHQTVDGRPYGGGVGMVLKVGPIYEAILSLGSKVKSQKSKVRRRIVLFSPRGKKFNQEIAKKWSKMDQLILVCGRYEGVDERVADYLADEVVSVGDYVLNGGEVAAMAVIEAVARLVPGFIAKKESAEKFDHPQYTRPEVFEAKSEKRKAKSGRSNKKVVWRVPKVLLSGDPKKIQKWRREQVEQSSVD